jgi:hypothetical protein
MKKPAQHLIAEVPRRQAKGGNDDWRRPVDATVAHREHAERREDAAYIARNQND